MCHVRLNTIDVEVTSRLLQDPDLLQPTYCDFVAISIDGELRWPAADPFRADHPRIVPEACPLCGPGCGVPYIAVRRTASHVIWYLQPDRYNDAEPMSLDETFVFDPAQYDAMSEGRSGELPRPSDEEVTDLLRFTTFPQPDEVLYAVPALRDDPTGLGLVTHLDRAIRRDRREFRSVPEPSAVTELQIGLDRPGFPEARWCVGSTEDVWAISFCAEPRLPVWVTCDAISEVLGQRVPVA